MNTVIERTGFDPAQDADNGNRFLTGNGNEPYDIEQNF